LGRANGDDVSKIASFAERKATVVGISFDKGVSAD